MKNTTYRWINDSVGKTRGIYVLLILSSALQSVLMVFFALAVKDLVNCAVYGTSNVSVIIKNASITVLVATLAFVLGGINKVLMEKCRITAETNIKKRVFNNLLKKDYSKISAFKSGDILNRLINDSSIVANGYSTLFPTLVSMLTKMLLAIIVLVILQPIFTLFLCLSGILMMVISLFLRRFFKKLFKKTREVQSEVVAFVNETTSNLLAVKVFASEDKFTKIADGTFDRYKTVFKRQKYLSSLLSTMLGYVFVMIYVITVIWGAFGIFYNWSGIDFGMLTAMLQIVNQLQSPFANLTGLLSVYYETLASAERIIEIENVKEQTETEKVDYNQVYADLKSIELKDVTFAYDREKILDGASLSIKKGDVVIIKGTSGIGKSTLMKLLLGVYDSFEGKITLNLENKEINLSSGERGLFAYVPQGNLLFSGTILENVCFLNDNATNEQIQKAMDVACLDFVNDFPSGINTVIGEKGQGLSEGQSQRVAIARAIMSNRPILLLDEATSALDEKTESQILSNIKNLGDNKTVVMISHKTACDEISTRTIRIVDGKIVE